MAFTAIVLLDLLSAVGVIDDPVPKPVDPAGPTISTNTPANSDPSIKPPNQLVGILPGNHIDPDKDRASAPKSQPSLFWKALAFTLKERLSLSTSLRDDNQALFLGTQGQAGVPAGRNYPDVVTKYQTFVKADAVQILDRPYFLASGDSYYELLSLYMRSVIQDSDSSNDRERRDIARRALIDAKTSKDQAWQQARARYEAQSSSSDSTNKVSFIDFVLKDDAYNKAWQFEDQCEKAYTKLQEESLAGVSGKLDLLKLADDRLQERVGLNMPVVASSDDYIFNTSVENGAPMKVDPKTIYYRPLYNLPNLPNVCNDWQANLDKLPDFGPYIVDLIGAINASWSDLGHERLDGAKPPVLTPDQTQLLKALQVSITFKGEPKVFDVNRGDWDVVDFRGKYSSTAASLPPLVQRNFCKTVRMMLAWGVEIIVKLPASTEGFDDKPVNVGFLNVPMMPVHGKTDELHFVAGSNTYPLLLATLAAVV